MREIPHGIDGHGHCSGTGLQGASANLLAPPDYTVTDIPGVVAELKKYAASETSKKYGIIPGFGYDDRQLPRGSHGHGNDQEREDDLFRGIDSVVQVFFPVRRFPDDVTKNEIRPSLPVGLSRRAQSAG